MIPFIHLFKTFEGFYFFDVNMNVSAKIDEETYLYLLSLVSKNPLTPSEQVKKTLSILHNDGFLSSKHVKSVLHPATNLLPFYLESRLEMITLQVTQNCNLKCEYCAYSGDYLQRSHSNINMTFEMARKCLDYILEHSKDVNKISVGFYGGEPLIALDLVKKCVEYIETNKGSKDVNFSITTNGTLINEDVLQLLSTHKFTVMISLDGPKEIHDKNRKFRDGQGSFDIIMENLQYIKKNYPDLYKEIRFNMVLDPTVQLSCVNEFIGGCEELTTDNIMTSPLNQFYLEENNFVPNENYLITTRYELFKYLMYKQGRLAEHDTSIISKNEYVSMSSRFEINNQILYELPDIAHPSGTCIPGSKRLFVDVNGNFYPCEKISEASVVARIGHIDSGFDLKAVSKQLNVCKCVEDKCVDCWAFRLCGNCVCQSDDATDISPEIIDKFCKLRKVNAENILKTMCLVNELKFKSEVM